MVRQLCGFPEYDHLPVHATAKPARPPPDPSPFKTDTHQNLVKKGNVCSVLEDGEESF